MTGARLTPALCTVQDKDRPEGLEGASGAGKKSRVVRVAGLRFFLSPCGTANTFALSYDYYHSTTITRGKANTSRPRSNSEVVFNVADWTDHQACRECILLRTWLYKLAYPKVLSPIKQG